MDRQYQQGNMLAQSGPGVASAPLFVMGVDAKIDRGSFFDRMSVVPRATITATTVTICEQPDLIHTTVTLCLCPLYVVDIAIMLPLGCILDCGRVDKNTT